MMNFFPSYILKIHLPILFEFNVLFALKVHFVIHSLIPPYFSKKVEIFIPVEAFKYILFVLKLFLANSLVWRSNRRICVFFMSTWKFQRIVAYATGTSKTYITHKRNLGIDWKFGNKLISSISIDLCYKNSMLGSQNGPLRLIWPPGCIGSMHKGCQGYWIPLKDVHMNLHKWILS